MPQQRILITGGNGTVGKALQDVAQRAGHQVTAWDRHLVRYGDDDAMSRYLQQVSPAVVVNLAIASQYDPLSLLSARALNEDFPALLGTMCARQGIRFLQTSSVMVFENSGDGPFTTDSVAAASDGYGKEKRLAEEQLREQCPEALIVRLGWQMGKDLQGNTMSHFLSETMKSKQEIVASNRWFPACSFVQDTAAVLLDLATKAQTEGASRVYHVDGNRGWSFFEIAQALKTYLNQSWTIRHDDTFVFDQRLLGALTDRCDIGRILQLPNL